MRNEQTFGASPDRLTAEPATSGRAPDFLSDAANAIAAIGRMEAVIRSDRAAFGRLRAEMGAMATALTEAKLAMLTAASTPDGSSSGKAVDLGALVLDLEGRLNAMLYLIEFVADGGAAVGLHAVDEAGPAAALAAEPPGAAAAQSPTVAATPAATKPEAPDPLTVALSAAFAAARLATAPAAGESERVPTVSAVVSRLGRTGDRPAAEAGDAPGPAQAADGTVPSVSALGAMVEALTARVEAEPQPTADEAADALGESDPAETEADAAPPVAAEVELLTSFARMEAVPLLVSEIGTAVIFARSEEPNEPDAFAAVAGTADPDGDPAASLYEQPEIAAEPPPAGAAETDPAALLLERVSAVLLPGTALAGEPTPEPLPVAADPEPAPPEPMSAPSVPVAPDPLAPLKAMSAEERIALFS